MFKKITRNLKLAGALGFVIMGYALESHPCYADEGNYTCWNQRPNTDGACCYGRSTSDHPCDALGHSGKWDERDGGWVGACVRNPLCSS